MTTLLVGLDGASQSLLSRLIDAEVLPTVEKLLEGGVSGRLESQVPPWTPSAWSSLYTGMNPGKHGVFGFLDFDGYDWGVVDASVRRERPFWELLDHFGLSSVVVNAPVTHPPRPFEGALIPGYTAPENPRCHPEGLLDEVRAAVGEYTVYPEGDGPSIDEYREVVQARGRAFRYLADQVGPDFGFVQFQVTDTVFHDRPGDREAIRAVYEAVDEEMATILDVCDPDTVFVVSDHGIGPYSGYTFRVNEFLRQAGFVETKRGGVGMPSWTAVRGARGEAGFAAGSPGEGILAWLSSALARAGMTSQRIETVLESVGLDELVRRRVPKSVISAGTEQVDFAASRAYMRARVECGVRINLEGREPNGVVPPHEYETVREQLVKLLSSARTPAGDLVFDDVAPREAYFDGPAADGGVDIVTVPAGFDHFLSTGLADGVFDEPSEPWNHKLGGIIAASGTAIEPDDWLGDAHLFDVAPTILATFDVPADVRMDGAPLPIVGSSGERSYPRASRRRERVATDHEVERRLSELGYLDRER